MKIRQEGSLILLFSHFILFYFIFFSQEITSIFHQAKQRADMILREFVKRVSEFQTKLKIDYDDYKVAEATLWVCFQDLFCIFCLFLLVALLMSFCCSSAIQSSN